MVAIQLTRRQMSSCLNNTSASYPKPFRTYQSFYQRYHSYAPSSLRTLQKWNQNRLFCTRISQTLKISSEKKNHSMANLTSQFYLPEREFPWGKVTRIMREGQLLIGYLSQDRWQEEPLKFLSFVTMVTMGICMISNYTSYSKWWCLVRLSVNQPDMHMSSEAYHFYHCKCKRNGSNHRSISVVNH